MSVFPAKLPLSYAQAGQLLDLLCDSDAFREQFQSDPSGALAAHSLQPLSANRCAPVTSLASKEAFQAARTTLQQHLTHAAMFTLPHYFETGSSYTSAPVSSVA